MLRVTRTAPLIVFVLALSPGVAFAYVNLTSVGGYLFDIAETTDFSSPGSLVNGTIDAYDVCYSLRVGGTSYMPTGATVMSLGGRQAELPAQTIAGLSVRRLVYVPSAGNDWARYLEVLSNTGAAPVTTTVEVYGNLGSDGGTVVTGSSSGDTSVSTADIWFATDDFSDGAGDPSLAHVFSDASPGVAPSAVSLSGDNLSYQWNVTVPAGGRAIIMHFAIQTSSRAASMSEARALQPPPDAALMGADTYLEDIVNWEVGFPTAPCVGLSEGAACTTSDSDAGICRATRCCTGCFDGTTCRSGRLAAQCGAGGATCASCADADACTSDVCTSGVCSNPDAPAGTRCEDGAFCTASDTCDGSGTCVGSGDPCNDLQSCTVDTCDESGDRCTNVGLADGMTCTASGAPGVCRSSACCAGCWTGTACLSGTTAAACGAGGGSCASCADGDPCTSDVCITGVCSNPFAPTGTGCDDGLFCTATDRCDGSGACMGSGDGCDDRLSCTTDTCDESADSCAHTPGSGCLIGGVCVAMGAINRTYPCQTCDPAANVFDWSPLVAGTMCGASVCASGRLTERSCDSAGLCATLRTTCVTGACADGVSCEMACTEGSCASGEYCDSTSGACARLRADGATCDDAAACESGACVDAVCCASVCDGTCERCDMPSSLGACEPVPAGDDPDGECTGECDGARACDATEDAGTSADAGTTRDAGTARDASTEPDAGARIDAGASAPEIGGCGCRAARRSRSSAGLALLLLLACIVRRRWGADRQDAKDAKAPRGTAGARIILAILAPLAVREASVRERGRNSVAKAVRARRAAAARDRT